MKLTLALLLLCGLSMAQSYHIADTSTEGTLVRAEKLTAEEKAKLHAADMEVAKAQNALSAVRREIAEDHKMGFQQSYNTYGEDWFEFDGDWILSRHRSLPAITFGGYVPIHGASTDTHH